MLHVSPTLPLTAAAEKALRAAAEEALAAAGSTALAPKWAVTPEMRRRLPKPGTPMSIVAGNIARDNGRFVVYMNWDLPMALYAYPGPPSVWVKDPGLYPVLPDAILALVEARDENAVAVPVRALWGLRSEVLTAEAFSVFLRGGR